MRRRILSVALVLGSIAPGPARADDEPPVEVATPWPNGTELVDAGVTWLTMPPPLTLYTPGKYGVRIGGLPDGFVQRQGPLYAVGVHFVRTITLARPLVVPLLGVGMSIGSGGYADDSTAGAAHFHDGGLSFFGTIELPGIGLMTEHATWRALATVNPALDFVTSSGHFNDATVDFDATGYGMAFAIHTRAELCFRGSPGERWFCATGGPTLLEGGTWLNGGYVGFGAAF